VPGGSGTGTGAAGTPDRPPAQRSGPVTPLYPEAARRRGWHGLVIIKAMILRNGSVGETAVVQSTGHDLLDKAAIQAVRQRKYHPALKDGRPVDCYVMIKIRFELEE
jgi:protein TonB